MNKTKMLKNVTTAVIISFCIIISLTIYANIVRNKLIGEVKVSLKEIAEQSANIINNEVNSEFNLMNEISLRLTHNESLDMDYAMKQLNDIVDNYPFKRMGMVLKDGTTITTDNVEMNLSDREYVQQALNGETVITDQLKDKAGGDAITVFAAPIYVKDEISAVLFATFSIDSFKSLLSVQTFNGKGYSYIVKRNGDIVVDSPHPSSYQNIQNIFESIKNVDKSNECYEELSKNLNDNKSGYIIFKNQINKYMYYTPLEVNDWYLLNVVPKEVADSSIKSVMHMTYILCVVVSGLSILYMLYIAKLQKKSTNSYNRILYVDSITNGKTFTKFTIDTKISLSQNEKKAAYIVLDLDNFKLINEMYGYEMGDETIRYMHHTIEACAKKDTIFGRCDADRFVLLMYYDTKEELEERLLNYCHLLQRDYPPQYSNNYILKPAIGIYLIQDHNENIQRMQTLATIARTSIKNKVNVYYSFYEENYRDTLMFNKQLEDQMEKAIMDEEFIPYFQPKYDAVTHKINGAEALVRWKKPDGTIIPPNQFIPVAEKSGFIVRIDLHMFKSVCKKQREFLNKKVNPVPISVNVSRKVLENPSFIDEYMKIINQYNVPVELVELEITESALFENQNELKFIVNILHEKGFKILMDDFGTGYSSLMMLKMIAVDTMKLDKSFVDDYSDSRGKKIITCVVNLAKSLNMMITAEGVENIQQLEFLKHLKCDTIQGYYFSKPLTEADYEMKLKENNLVMS